jgi:2-polyprenyl-3-methyl-5-hydroxy-6-metoxy-1,4-benzoquinol methylase
MSHPVVEGGVIAGNFENKYESRNPIARHLMQGFLDAVTELVSNTGCQRALEVGCGEGKLAIHLKRSLGIDIRGTDFSPQILEQARANALRSGVNVPFEVLDLNQPGADTPMAELVVCCEVLEHLPDPEAALRRLATTAERALVLSVPREPLWRALNVLRGKYWRDLGNTPGHLQHWSQRTFIELLNRHLDVVEVRAPLPWTVVLAKPRRRAD